MMYRAAIIEWIMNTMVLLADGLLGRITCRGNDEVVQPMSLLLVVPLHSPPRQGRGERT